MARLQGEQLQRLLDQLLAAASADHVPTHWVRRSLVDAAALAEEARQAARLTNPNHRITIEAAGPLSVRVDPSAISRILGNLLDNAAAYSPRGAAIRLTARRDGGHALLAVQDQGPGIPLADRDRIFQRHVRLNPVSASNRDGLGLGLGLYIARRLATAHRGQLQLSDPPGAQGARFELRLPLAAGTPSRGGSSR
jgi:signal transduction histidine kinase